MINATVSGNIGKAAVLRSAGSSQVASFSVASNTKIKGDKVTTWVRCSLWGTRAEKLVDYLEQGRKIVVSGALGTSEYEGRTSLELNVQDLDFMGSAEGEQRRERAPEQRPSTDAGSGAPADDDDPPF